MAYMSAQNNVELLNQCLSYIKCPDISCLESEMVHGTFKEKNLNLLSCEIKCTVIRKMYELAHFMHTTTLHLEIIFLRNITRRHSRNI